MHLGKGGGHGRRRLVGRRDRCGPSEQMRVLLHGPARRVSVGRTQIECRAASAGSPRPCRRASAPCVHVFVDADADVTCKEIAIVLVAAARHPH